MAKLTLSTIGSRYGSIDALNANFDAIEAALENTLSLDGTAPNGMEVDLDMNSHKIINLSDPTNNGDAVTKGWLLEQEGNAAASAEAAALSASLAEESAVEAAATAASLTPEAYALKSANLSDLQSVVTARTTLGLAIGVNVQAYDAQLADVAGLTPTDNGVVIGNGTNFVVESGATLKTSLGLTIGTDVQAYDAELAALAGLTSAANKVPMFSGSGTATLLDFKDEDNMSSDSATAVPSQQSVKAYADALITSRIVQVVEATPYVTYSSTATAIPADDTIPQNTEGAEWNTVTITPSNASNRLRIEAFFSCVSGSSSAELCAAIFQDATAGALAATSESPSVAATTMDLRVEHEMAAGTTSATTFKLRAGPASGTMYINGTSSGRRFGGVCVVRLRVTEIRV